MLIALVVLLTLIVLLAIAGVICYYTLAVPNRKPLTDAEREICRGVIAEGRAYPFVCKQAVKLGQCPCLPCARLEQGKRGTSGAGARHP